MRHRVVKKKFGRDLDHRKALMRNLTESLILNEKIKTTIEKAKYLRPYVEKIITRSKDALANDKIKTLNTVKVLRKKVYSEKVIKKLVTEIAEKYKNTNGGYTRIRKLGNRPGDNAFYAEIELVNNKPKKETAVTKKAKLEEKTDE